MNKFWIVILIMFFALAGCAPAPALVPEMDTVLEATSQLSDIPDNVAPATDLPDNLLAILPDALLTLAKEDLSKRLGVDVAEITLFMATPVDWPDASLGCPEPDMMYAQVITPGYQILFSVDEHPYAYHTDRDSYVVYCERGLTLPVDPDEIQDGIPWVPVD